jgi:hypothetical protein
MLYPTFRDNFPPMTWIEFQTFSIGRALPRKLSSEKEADVLFFEVRRRHWPEEHSK